MELPETLWRRELTDLFHCQDWEKIESRGIKKIYEASTEYDCIRYIIRRLGLIDGSGVIESLRSGEVITKPENWCLVLYHNSESIKTNKPVHHGLYEDGEVVSKWSYGPVYKHNIEDIPLDYGNIVEFRRIDEDALMDAEIELRGGHLD